MKKKVGNISKQVQPQVSLNVIMSTDFINKIINHSTQINFLPILTQLVRQESFVNTELNRHVFYSKEIL